MSYKRPEVVKSAAQLVEEAMTALRAYVSLINRPHTESDLVRARGDLVTALLEVGNVPARDLARKVSRGTATAMDLRCVNLVTQQTASAA
jgi:hypothetical protein